MKKGRVVTRRSRDGRRITSQLKIANAQCIDTAHYICAVKTEGGKHSSKEFRVQMYDRSFGPVPCGNRRIGQ